MLYGCKRFYPKRVLLVVVQRLCERSCKTTNELTGLLIETRHSDEADEHYACAQYCVLYYSTMHQGLIGSRYVVQCSIILNAAVLSGLYVS